MNVFKDVLEGRRNNVLDYLANGGNPDFSEREDGYTLLHLAAQEGEVLILSDLIASGGDFNKKDEAGFTPIRYSVGEGALDCVELLVNIGAKLSDTNDEALGTLKELALAWDHCKVFDFLALHEKK